MKDLIIIGAGPAGITAAIYAARKKMDFMVVTKDIGGQVVWSGGVENYTGYQFVSGQDLIQKFKEHLESFQFDLKEGIDALMVEKEDGYFKVHHRPPGTKGLKTDFFSAKTVVIATGKKPRMLNVPGETEFKGRGITYCATCDGPLFAGKEVAIVGGGNSAMDAALQMVKIARKVYIVNITEKLKGDPVMQDKIKDAPNLEILNRTHTVEIKGDKFVNALVVETAGQVRELPVEGIFIEIGLTPNTDFIDFVKKDTLGEIVINCAAETSVPGVFAAGDCTSVPEKQIIIAAGDGAKAALSASKYLSTHL